MIPSDDLNKNKINLKNPEKIGWEGDTPRTGNFSSNIYSKIDKISRPVFWTALVVFVLTAAGIGFYFYSYLVNRDIAFVLNAPQSVLSGVPFDIEAGAKNNFNNSLNDVKISLVLPNGAFFIGESQGKRYYDKSFGNLGKDANFQERIPIVVIPGGQTLKFDVEISYYTPALGSKARFKQIRTVEVSADEPALKLDISAPQKILNNEDFEIEIRYQNISNVQFENAELKLDYPSFFTFKSATVAPSSGNNVWELGSLPAKGVEGNFIIKGKAVNPNDSLSNFEINGELIAEISGQKYSINKKSAQLSIVSSPLVLNVSLNDSQNYVASLRDNLRYKINYRNSSDIGLNDIVIIAKLTGEMFDFKTLGGGGFFDSKSNTITWNVANTSNLRVINPGGEGYVEFQIQTKESYPIKRQGDKNFMLNVAAEISSPTVPYYVSSDKTISFANIKNNVSGAVAIVAKAPFYDPSSGISNKGQFPPRVNQPTNFTIHWTITNYSTDVSNVKISAFLQSGVRWTDQVKSSINSVPSYDERTQEIVWNIDKVLATQGVILSPIEAIFQVEATPNVTQVGQNMPLLGQTTIQAKDDFNNIILNNSAAPLTSGTTVVQ
ncbi:MAG: hypothetical protein D4Q79_01915 [Spirochaetia bacterium]|nr:MAG: hypothetical protein D4Q79_01915 [Spirochaetia bacterium]